MSNDLEPSTFYFRVATPEGGVHAGKMDAQSAAHAERTLLRSGLKPLRIESRPFAESWLHREIGGIGGRRLGTAECEIICRELALLLNAGLTLTEALGVMLDAQSPRSKLARFTGATRNALRLGHTLSSAVGASGFDLPSDLLPVVSAGEESGTLPAALSMLAESYADAVRFNRAVVAAVAYPAFLVIVSFAVLGLIAFVVAPSLAGLFASMNKPVPPTIALLSALADVVRINAALLGVLAGGAIAATIAAGRSVKRLLRTMLFRLPGTRDALGWVTSRRFASTLRLYLISGVPLGSALPGALRAADFPVPDAQLGAVVSDVRTGAKLAAALARAGLLPRKLIQMVEIGESSGRLVDVLGSTLTEAKSKIEQRLALVSTIVAPVLILLIGGLVGSIVFSVFSALLQINEVVS